MRPFIPVPWTRVKSSPCSRAKRRTAGDGRAAPPGASVSSPASGVPSGPGPPPVGPTGITSLSKYPVVAAGPGAAAAGAEAGDSLAECCTTAVGAPALSTSAMGAPIGNVSPSGARIRSNKPATGEGISMVTLSVTTSTSGSNRSILSPGCFSHLPIVPSTTDSPTWGSSMVTAKVHHPSSICGQLAQGLRNLFCVGHVGVLKGMSERHGGYVGAAEPHNRAIKVFESFRGNQGRHLCTDSAG